MKSKLPLYHLGSNLSKCKRVLDELKKFFAKAERMTGDFEGNLNALRELITNPGDVKNFHSLKKVIIKYAESSIRDLRKIKEATLSVIGASEGEERIILAEDEEIVGSMSIAKEDGGNTLGKQYSHRVKTSFMFINRLLKEAYNDIRKLVSIAKTEIHEVIDPDIASLEKLIVEAKELSDTGALLGSSLLNTGNGKLLKNMVILFKYVIGNAARLEGIEKEEWKDLKQLKYIDDKLGMGLKLLNREFRDAA